VKGITAIQEEGIFNISAMDLFLTPNPQRLALQQ